MQIHKITIAAWKPSTQSQLKSERQLRRPQRGADITSAKMYDTHTFEIAALHNKETARLNQLTLFLLQAARIVV